MFKQPLTKQQQLGNHIRYAFMVLQHRIEEQNWMEATQKATALSRMLLDMQQLVIEQSSASNEVNNETKDETTA